MCWNSTGSPPPAALKKLVPKWRSVSSIVTAPASTGITAISRYAVISHVHTKSGIFIIVIPGARMFRMVVMMLIEPMIDDAPMMCTAKIVRSMPMPVCTDSGGYSVQPALAAPPGTMNDESSRTAANGSSQKLQLFMRANAMSGAPIISGTCQFAKPTAAGMIAPKIMTSPCTVLS